MDSLLPRLKQIMGGIASGLDQFGTGNYAHDPALEGMADSGSVNLANEAAKRAGLAAMLKPGTPWYGMIAARDSASQDAYNSSITGAVNQAETIRKMREASGQRQRNADWLKSLGAMHDAHNKPLFTDAQIQTIQAMPPDEQAKIAQEQLFPKDTTYGGGPVAGGYTERDTDPTKLTFHRTQRDYVPFGAAPALQTPEANDARITRAKAIAEYREPAPTGRAAYNGEGLATMAEVRRQNPAYDVTQFGMKNATRTAFAKGKQGDQVRSFNTSIDHLSTLNDLIDALGNGDVNTVNMIANAWHEQTGKPAPVGFEATRDIVADEVAKSIIGGQNAQSDRDKIASRLRASNSPAQMREVMQDYQKLMGGQLRNLKRQYEAATGLHDFEYMLSPDAIPYLQHGTDAPATGATRSNW